jgi:hypothetical protein
MYQVFVPTFLFWPGEREVRATLPMVFREHFERCISIIDCFEIFVQRSAKFKERASTFSSYKHHNTIKYLISLTPQGTVSFISLGYGARCSDKFIAEDSGYIDNLKEGDVVLADRGFLVNDIVNLCDAELKNTCIQSQTIPVDSVRSGRVPHPLRQFPWRRDRCAFSVVSTRRGNPRLQTSYARKEVARS